MPMLPFWTYVIHRTNWITEADRLRLGFGLECAGQQLFRSTNLVTNFDWLTRKWRWDHVMSSFNEFWRVLYFWILECDAITLIPIVVPPTNYALICRCYLCNIWSKVHFPMLKLCLEYCNALAKLLHRCEKWAELWSAWCMTLDTGS